MNGNSNDQKFRVDIERLLVNTDVDKEEKKPDDNNN